MSKKYTPEQRIEAFWAKVQKTETCWLWIGAITSNGYGQFIGPNRKKVAAHRFSYLLEHEFIPEGLELDHLCRVRHCIRPLHLEPVTRLENIMRGSGPDTQRAIHAAKTHCKQGHEFTPENTYYGKQRQCRTCQRLHMRAIRASI